MLWDPLVYPQASHKLILGDLKGKNPWDWDLANVENKKLICHIESILPGYMTMRWLHTLHEKVAEAPSCMSIIPCCAMADAAAIPERHVVGNYGTLRHSYIHPECFKDDHWGFLPTHLHWTSLEVSPGCLNEDFTLTTCVHCVLKIPSWVKQK